jgi:hypothetical protein
MISLSGVTSCTVAGAPPGSLVLVQFPGGWLNCLVVIRASSVTLPGLDYPNPAGNWSALLLQGISDQLRQPTPT